MKRGYETIPQDHSRPVVQQYMSDHISYQEKPAATATSGLSSEEDLCSRDRHGLSQRAHNWCRRHLPYFSADASHVPLLDDGYYYHEKQAHAPSYSQTRPRTKVLKLLAAATLAGASFMAINHLLLGPASSQVGITDNAAGIQAPFNTPEQMIQVLPSTESIRNIFRTAASQPHMAGSHADKVQADWVQSKWDEFGIPNTTIDTYYPWLNTPKYRRLAIVQGPAESLYEAKLQEDPVPEDPATTHPDETPTFHGYSADGNVTGPVVYVNYGRITDFQFLAARGVNFTGTIALMRHGQTARGLKVRTAEEFGCIGAVLYSDPMEDGPYNKVTEHGEPAEPYPRGPWRSSTSVERGTVQYTSLFPGDMLTPGYAATENATRLDPSEAYGMPRIPSLPISWSDALPLFMAMEGLGVKGEIDWLGGLCQVNYYSGPSTSLVNLVNLNDYQIKPIWNVIGRIEGSTDPHRAIILGTHRDAFGFGGADAASGTAVLIELSRVLGLMLEHGWQPRRTLILASWDGQGYGSVGSTEWVEDHKDWLDDEAVAYINLDQAVSGPHFSVKASPLLTDLLYQVTSELIDPKTSLPLFDAWKEHREKTVDQEGDPEAPVAVDLIEALGGGSDYMAFYDHLGITSMSMGFEGPYGVYHSIYDSIYWMEHFGDPTYEYHQLMVKLWGLVALRLADSAVLPFSPLAYATDLLTHVANLAEDQGCATLPDLSAAVNALYETTLDFDHKLRKLERKLGKHDLVILKHKKKHKKLLKKLVKANERLGQFERAFIDPAGLPGREWFKHIVYAPSLWSGLDAEVFPTITEAINQGANPSFTREMEERAANLIESARSLLKGKHARFVGDDPEDVDDPENDDDPEEEV